jgi:hypothetical protein
LLPPHSLFLPLLPLLSSLLPPPPLPRYPTVVAALPLLSPPPSLSTLPPPLPQYPVVVAVLPLSHRVSLAIVLTAVITALPLILLLLLPPRCPCPGPCCRPCCRRCCRAFPVLAAAAAAAIPHCQRRVAPVLAAIFVRHVYPCPCPHALVRPRPLTLALLPSPLRPRALIWPLPFACVTLAPCCHRQRRPLLPLSTITINSSAQLTTTTTRIHWTLFLIEGGDGGHYRLQRRLMAAAAMASLPLPTMTTIGAVPSAPSHRCLHQ